MHEYTGCPKRTTRFILKGVARQKIEIFKTEQMVTAWRDGQINQRGQYDRKTKEKHPDRCAEIRAAELASRARNEEILICLEKTMLTEHEQMADHEARISRQIPLNEPLENIGQITKDIENLHNGNARLFLAAHALGGLLASGILDKEYFDGIGSAAQLAADATLAALNAK